MEIIKLPLKIKSLKKQKQKNRTIKIVALPSLGDTKNWHRTLGLNFRCLKKVYSWGRRTWLGLVPVFRFFPWDVPPKLMCAPAFPLKKVT